MSTAAERKAALLLQSLHPRDRRYLLARLPADSAAAIRAHGAHLRRLRFPLTELRDELLSDELRGSTTPAAPTLERIVALSRKLPPAWFARVIGAWPNLDRNFCVALLDAPIAAEVRRELVRVESLSKPVAEAVAAEVVGMRLSCEEA